MRRSTKSHTRLAAPVAALLIGTAAALGGNAAGGWLDTTRIAAADSELWRQILMDNRSHVLKSLDNFEKVLASLRQALEYGDEKQLLRLLEAGKKHRESV